jgi:hypothetical protein
MIASASSSIPQSSSISQNLSSAFVRLAKRSAFLVMANAQTSTSERYRLDRLPSGSKALKTERAAIGLRERRRGFLGFGTGLRRLISFRGLVGRLTGFGKQSDHAICRLATWVFFL